MPNSNPAHRSSNDNVINTTAKPTVRTRSNSFSGRGSPVPVLRRPKTEPSRLPSLAMETSRPKLTKILFNVTIERSIGAVQVLVSPESTVEDLIAAAMRQYVKEGRRPVFLGCERAVEFGLHYSQFSLESLDREEKLVSLGSRNFFLCRRNAAAESGSGGGDVKSCSKEAGVEAKFGLPWLKFRNFLQ
ncbi:hypothetical protein AKJ16_DCAP13505 [Drosera capensis]